jgi:hypothetical protein
MRTALERASLQPQQIGAVILDPHANARQAQLAAIAGLALESAPLIDPARVYGNCLAVATALAVGLTLDAAVAGRWPGKAAVSGDAAFKPGRPVLINACGFMSGSASLVVLPHGRD